MNKTSNGTILISRPWDACDHLTSTHAMKVVASVMNCGIMPSIILLLGVPGNVLCLFVFWKQGARERVNALLFSLAVADLAKLLTLQATQTNCVFSLLGRHREAANWMSVTQFQLGQYYRYANVVSQQLNALVALDRALSVSLPLTAHRILSFGRMVAAIVTIYVISLVLFIPVFLLYTTNWTVDPTTNVTIAVLSHRPHYPFPPEVPRHIVAVLTAVLQPTSVITVTVSSVLVIVKLGVARKKRKQMSNSQSETSAGQSEAKITKMLLSVCILFIIFTLPETIGTLVSFLLPEFGLKRCYHNTYELYYRTVVVASCLNSSVNFIAYVSLSTKFRTTLGQILPCSTVRGTAGDTSTPGESTLSVSRLTSS